VELSSRLSEVSKVYSEAPVLRVALVDELTQRDIQAILRALNRLSEYQQLIATGAYKQYWAKYSSSKNTD
jgi:hypothetical protein